MDSRSPCNMQEERFLFLIPPYTHLFSQKFHRKEYNTSHESIRRFPEECCRQAWK